MASLLQRLHKSEPFMKIQLRNQLAHQYIVESILGEGTFGVVYKAINLAQNKQVAIKLFKDHNITNGIGTTTARQIRIMAFFGHNPHPNIMPSNKLIRKGEYIAVEMDYYPQTLSKFMNMNYPHNPLISMNIIKKVNQGLDHIHKNNYIHRDIKPSNILLDSTGQPVITDFGLVKKLHFLKNMEMTDNPGTVFYRAPQQFSKLSYGQPVDMWALGVICLQFFSPAPISQERQHQWVLFVSTMFHNGEIVPLTQQYYSILQDALINVKSFELNAQVLERLLKVMPDERITSRQLNAFIKKYQ